MTTQATITIDLECTDTDTLGDIITALDGVLPYMADNVLVRSTVVGPDPDARLSDDLRNALFAAYGDAFRDTTDEARYTLTRTVLGLDSEVTVSWSRHSPFSITNGEAVKVLDFLRVMV